MLEAIQTIHLKLLHAVVAEVVIAIEVVAVDAVEAIEIATTNSASQIRLKLQPRHQQNKVNLPILKNDLLHEVAADVVVVAVDVDLIDRLQTALTATSVRHAQSEKIALNDNSETTGITTLSRSSVKRTKRLNSSYLN